MNSFVPSVVFARFRATSRKLFRPKLTFSALIVSNCTSELRRPFSSSSMNRPPASRLAVARPEARGTGVPDINLPDTMADENGTARAAGPVALNIAYPSLGKKCSALAAGHGSRDAFVPDAAHRQTRRRLPLRAPWVGPAPAAARCSVGTSAPDAAFQWGPGRSALPRHRASDRS